MLEEAGIPTASSFNHYKSPYDGFIRDLYKAIKLLLARRKYSLSQYHDLMPLDTMNALVLFCGCPELIKKFLSVNNVNLHCLGAKLANLLHYLCLGGHEKLARKALKVFHPLVPDKRGINPGDVLKTLYLELDR